MSNCVYADYDGPTASVVTTRLRRARKVHKCCECGDVIQPGDLYENVDGNWGGEWANFKTCARCVIIRVDYFHGWTFTMMAEDFEATHGFDYRDGIPADFAPCGAAPAQGTETP